MTDDNVLLRCERPSLRLTPTNLARLDHRQRARRRPAHSQSASSGSDVTQRVIEWIKESHVDKLVTSHLPQIIPLKLVMNKNTQQAGATSEEVGVINKEVGVISEEVGVISEEVGLISEEVGAISEEVGAIDNNASSHQ